MIRGGRGNRYSTVFDYLTPALLETVKPLHTLYLRGFFPQL